MKNILQYALTFVITALCVLLQTGCSTQKDGFVNRAYHNTTARYNGYFYSRESIREGVANIRAAHKDDYEDILPVYINPTQEEATAVFPQMDRALLKSSTVIKRHSMNIKGKERCRWIDDNYLAMGKAHFYKRSFNDAEKTFDYVVKEYKDSPERYEGMLWLIRTYVEAGILDKAGLVLGVANEDKEFPKKLKGELYKVNAVYYTARQNYQVAAENLEKALPLEKKKKNRLRLTYILAQLYQKAGRSNDALKYYDLVAAKSADYTMVFNARIFQAMAVQDRVSGYKVKDDLMRMLKDDKNLEYRDQIYYALAEIAFKERKDQDAVDYLKQSAEASTTNVKQKSKSFLRLAQYYFNQKLYEPADVYYDSAVTVLNSSHPEYQQIKKTAADLDELVKELRIIQEQDSLLALAGLSEEEREKKVTAVLKGLQRKADEEAEKKKQQAAQPVAPVTPPPGNSQTAAIGNFWVYNPQARTTGYNDFQKKWGNRKLEDNWRRSSKLSSEGGVAGFEDPGTPDPQAVGSLSAGSQINRVELEQNIPLTTQKRMESNEKIMRSLYNSGMIYKEKFKDTENAIESFENLVSRYDQSHYEAEAYYQLYRMYRQKETAGKNFFSSDPRSSSQYYKELILTEYPNSEFARLVENPEYLKNTALDNRGDLSDYARAYRMFRDRDLTGSLLLADSLITNRTGSPLQPKFYFLKAMINADLHNVEGYRDQLAVIVARFPNTPEAAEARRLLDFLKKKMPGTTGVDSTSTANAQPPANSVFSEETESEHYLIVAFPNKGQDPELIKVAVSNFNKAMFSLKKLDITNGYLGNENQMVIVKPFQNKQEAMEYYKIFIADQKNLKTVNTGENQTFVISVDNFVALYKSRKILDYLAFFGEKYKK